MLTSSGDSRKEGMQSVISMLIAASVGMKSCLRLIAPLVTTLSLLSSRDAADIRGKGRVPASFELYENGIVSAQRNAASAI
jgi:hypothetical protein